MAKINEIEGLEGFSEELLESVREESPELFEGLDFEVPGEPETPTAPEPVEVPPSQQEPGTPPEQEELEKEKPSKESADGTAKKPESKTVPLEALHEERERRRQLQQKLEQMQEQMMQLSSLQLEQARKMARQQTEGGRPEVEKDPLDELIDTKLADRMRPIEEQNAAMRYFRDFEARIVSQERAAKEAHADYEEITEPVVRLTNYWKEQAEKGDRESAAKLQHFLSQPNPPETAYTLGCAYQYQQIRQQQTQATPAQKQQQPPAPQKQMPRSDGISGGGVQSTPPLDLENITTEGWMKLPLETRRKLLAGGLE